MMNPEEQAREVLTQHRHNNGQLKESMLNRAEAEVDTPTKANTQTKEQVPKLTAKDRRYAENLKQSMLNQGKTQRNDFSNQG